MSHDQKYYTLKTVKLCDIYFENKTLFIIKLNFKHVLLTILYSQ